jgi:predicted amidophosphoribosyltransferase
MGRLRDRVQVVFGGVGARAATKKTRRWCWRCRKRWPQKDGLCRACGRELGDRQTTFERDQVRLHKRPTPARVDETPVSPRETTIDGVTYLVVYDGVVHPRREPDESSRTA